MDESKALTAVAPRTFAVATKDGADAVIALLRTGVGQFDLPKLAVPAGGGTLWSIPTLEGVRGEQTFEGVMLYVQGRQKKWWRVGFDERETAGPPDCRSTDGVHGVGDPGLEGGGDPAGLHDCLTCPWNQFGSHRVTRRGKDCSDFAHVFVLRRGARVPNLLTVPATSLKNLTRYALALADAGRRPQEVVTRFGLAPNDGVSTIAFSFGELLDEEACGAVAAVEAELVANLVPGR